MSAEEGNPFARWSRLKRAARKAEALDDERAAEPAGQEDAEHGDLQPAPEEPHTAGEQETVEPPEPLPRIEDLTAESDLSAFFRKGVPGTLRNAALRKMWSLDPAIRDYVGPAEYAWDFNKPGSMRGFGALEAGKSVVDFLSKAGGSQPQNVAAEAERAPQESVVATAGEDSVEPSPDTAGPDGLTKPPVPAETSQASVTFSQATDDAAAPTDEDEPAASQRRQPPRHGGALPR